MKMTDKIDRMMLDKGINRKELSDATGIPYTTISSFYDKGTENVKLSNLLKLADYFNCSLDYIADDNITYKDNIKKDILPCDSQLEKECMSSDNNLVIFNKRISDLSKKDKDKLFRIIEIFLEE